MTLLHVHSGNMFGGVERMLETLAPGNVGAAPVQSEYALCFEGRSADTLEAAGGTVHRLGAVRSRRVDEIWRARRALRSVLARKAWTVACVHSAWSQGIFGSTIVNSGVPLVRWLHAPEPGPRWMERWAARSRPSLVIANSEYTKRTAADRFPGIPMVVSHPPARPQSPSQRTRESVRASIGTPATALVIVIAARFESWKGHEALLDSLRLLPAGSWEAWILGGPQRPSERQYLDALTATSASLESRVRFIGEQPNVEEWLAAADIYCQPNTQPEPFGLAFVEALSAGLPVVTSNIGAAPEIVSDTCGILTPSSSPIEVAAALRTLIDDGDRRARLADGARRRARMFCDLSTSIARLAQALEPVALTRSA